MKTLILIRHAKSSWSSGAQSDKTRPLNDRGRKASADVGGWLAARDYAPDQVISSSATRCAETWQGINAILENTTSVQFEEALYMADESQMLKVLQAATGETVVMLGHMPGIGEFARGLRRDPPPHHASFDKYPSGAVTILEFKTDNWAEVSMGSGKSIDYVEPKSIA